MGFCRADEVRAAAAAASSPPELPALVEERFGELVEDAEIAEACREKNLTTYNRRALRLGRPVSVNAWARRQAELRVGDHLRFDVVMPPRRCHLELPVRAHSEEGQVARPLPPLPDEPEPDDPVPDGSVVDGGKARRVVRPTLRGRPPSPSPGVRRRPPRPRPEADDPPPF